MYMPIMKDRKSEIRALNQIAYCFSKDIIPMFEIMDNNHMNNLNTIEEIFKDKEVLIDLLRFSDGEYTNVDYEKVTFCFELREDNVYDNSLINLSEKFVPVISIKKNFEFDHKRLKELIIKIKKGHKAVALRLTEEYIEEYKEEIKELEINDYLILDIGEQPVMSKFIELTEFADIDTRAKKIVVNSPRLNNRKNGDYTEGITNLIDTSLRDEASRLKLDGYGDYAGLKDCLPGKGGYNGCAIALLYDYKINKFHCYLNNNSSDGVKRISESN